MEKAEIFIAKQHPCMQQFFCLSEAEFAVNEVAVSYADSCSKECVEKTRDRVNK